MTAPSREAPPLAPPVVVPELLDPHRMRVINGEAPLATIEETDAAPAGLRRWWVGRSEQQRLRILLVMWVVAFVAGLGLVIYGFGPLFYQRSQRSLLRTAKSDIDKAANEAGGLPGVVVPTKAVAPGHPVGILELGGVHLQQVVVEGVGASQTRRGPGHVPGTAGLGQPGNSVVVGRRHSFGGAFAALGRVRRGQSVLVTTTQGQSVYTVQSVRHRRLTGSTIDNVYGPTSGDQLTLITSASVLPWNDSSAVIVVARMRDTAYAPTPQGGRQDLTIGTAGDQGATSSVILAFLVYGIVVGASVMLYRRLLPRTAYLLTAAPILAMTIITAETLSRLLPAWT